MQSRVGLRNKRKALIIYLPLPPSVHFQPLKQNQVCLLSYYCCYQQLLKNTISQKSFLKFKYSVSYCFHFLSVLFISQVSFHTVPAASCKYEEKLLLLKHEEKLGLILFLLLLQDRRATLQCIVYSIPVSIETVVRK